MSGFIGLLPILTGNPGIHFAMGSNRLANHGRGGRLGKKYLPINKGNYSMETVEREKLFEKYLGEGWEEEYQSYRSNWIKFADEQYVSEYPLLVDLEISSLCNLNCPMCYTITERFKNRVNTKLMNFKLFTKLIDEISGKVPAVRLSLRGEPTIHNRFIECIRYAKAKDIKEVSFLTNGSKLSPGYFKKVLEGGADWITISFDGLGETYERIRRPLKYEKMLNRIKGMKEIKNRLKTNKPVIKIQSVWPAIRSNPEIFYETFVPYVDLIAFNPIITYFGKDEDISYEKNFLCPQLYQRLVIGADGLAMICSNDEDNSVVAGDTNRETIHDIWHGEKLGRIRDLHGKKDGFMELSVCRSCYLPRLTEDSESATVGGRKFIIRNYVNRNQGIGMRANGDTEEDILIREDFG